MLDMLQALSYNFPDFLGFVINSIPNYFRIPNLINTNLLKYLSRSLCVNFYY